MKKISLIVPVYNEEENIAILWKRLRGIAASIDSYAWEFVFVNDGSRDLSFDRLRDIASSDSRVIAIDFSRNFGKEVALTAGMNACTGDVAIFLDADLQHPPELLPQFLAKWESGAEIVSGIRLATEKKPFLKNLGSKIFYFLINKMGDAHLTPNSTDFKLIDRSVINALTKFTERNRLFRGLIDWCGFRTEYIEFVAPDRKNGIASYSYKKLVNLAINSFTSFSLLPLRITGYLGLVVTSCSFLLFIFMCICNFVLRNSIFSSISFVIVINTLILGIVLAALGLLALYIGQIHAEVVNRPLYIVREITRSERKKISGA